jgi:hypothetical protein
VPPAPNAELERELDRLYGLPLVEFVPARDELARSARADGKRELAESVKGLRKPAVAAWVVNQLARERELDIQRLVKAGEGLADAQADAAAGSSPEAFQEARREEQRALERLAEAARAIAERNGVSPTVVGRVTATLRAASLTTEGRELLKRGRLTQELEPPGFEALLGLPDAGARPEGRRQARPPRPAKAADARTQQRRAITEARTRVRSLRAEQQRLAKEAAAAEREAERAERDAAALRETADRARADAEKADEEQAEAERDLARIEKARSRR